MIRVLNRMMSGRSDRLGMQLFRYVVVGGVSFVVDYGLLYLLTERAGIHYLLSATCSFLAGLTVNYLISIRWVFGRSRSGSRLTEFLLFGVIGVVGLLLNNLLLWLLTDGLQLHYMVSKLVTALLVLCWNFGGRKTVLSRL